MWLFSNRLTFFPTSEDKFLIVRTIKRDRPETDKYFHQFILMIQDFLCNLFQRWKDKMSPSFSDAFIISVFGSHFFIIIQFGTRNNFHFKINFGLIFVLFGFNVIIFSNFFQVTMDRGGFENCFLFFSYWVDNISKRGRTKKTSEINFIKSS